MHEIERDEREAEALADMFNPANRPIEDEDEEECEVCGDVGGHEIGAHLVHDKLSKRIDELEKKIEALSRTRAEPRNPKKRKSR